MDLLLYWILLHVQRTPITIKHYKRLEMCVLDVWLSIFSISASVCHVIYSLTYQESFPWISKLNEYWIEFIWISLCTQIPSIDMPFMLPFPSIWEIKDWWVLNKCAYYNFDSILKGLFTYIYLCVHTIFTT